MRMTNNINTFFVLLCTPLIFRVFSKVTAPQVNCCLTLQIIAWLWECQILFIHVYVFSRVPTQLTWRQKRILRKFAELESLGSDKLVSEIEQENDHKLLVNVIEADRIVNNIVKPEKVDRFQRTITQSIRDKLGIKEPENVKKPAYPHHYHRIFSFWKGHIEQKNIECYIITNNDNTILKITFSREGFIQYTYV